MLSNLNELVKKFVDLNGEPKAMKVLYKDIKRCVR